MVVLKQLSEAHHESCWIKSKGTCSHLSLTDSSLVDHLPKDSAHQSSVKQKPLAL